MLLVVEAEAADSLDIFTGEGSEEQADILASLAPFFEVTDGCIPPCPALTPLLIRVSLHCRRGMNTGK